MTQDPKRLIVSERNELGLGLASARRQLPNELELTRLARRLAEAGVAVPADLVPGGTEARPPSPHERTRGGLRFKVYTGMGLGTLAVCAVLGARLQMRSPGSAPHAAIRPANADVSSQATRILSAPAPFVPSPAPPAMPEAERSRETARALPPTAAEAATPVVEASPKPLTSTSRDAARRGQSSAPSASHTWTPSGPTTHVPPTEQSTPTTELELVKQARNAVNADPARAYALTERCRAEFPAGAFAQERDYIAITALARLGRETQARALASSFRSRYPRSVYAAQLERLLGSE